MESLATPSRVRLLRSLTVLLGCFVLHAVAVPVAAESDRSWSVGGGNPKLRSKGDVLRISGKGWIRTNQFFLDPTVELDVRLVDAESEAALLLRNVVPGPGTYPPEFRVALGSGPLSGTTPGKDRAQRAPAPVLVPTGEWHHLIIRMERDVATVRVDDQLATSIEGREYQAGWFGLEITRGVLELRNVIVREASPFRCDQRPSVTTPTLEALKADGVVTPRALRRVQPEYPLEYLKREITGTVRVLAEVLADGSVGDVCVDRSAHPDLDIPAVAAARRWRFEPPIRDGKPIAVRVNIEVSIEVK